MEEDRRALATDGGVVKRKSPQQLEAVLAAMPSEWLAEFFDLLPSGCVFNLADSDWLAAQYKAGLTPMQVFKSCKQIEF